MTWDERVAAVWAVAGGREEADVLADIEALVAERPADDPAGRFEYASALDFVGREAEAEPQYRAALAGDLDDERRSFAVIQLASTLRNLGRPDEALALLDGPVTGHEDAVTAFRALALTDLGRAREAVRVLLEALAGHLPQYGRAVRHYAGELADTNVSPQAAGPVRLSGTLVCRDETEVDAVLTHLPRHLELTRAEPGCVRFDVTRDGDRPQWRVEEEFVDEPAFRAHQQRVAASDWGRATATIERRYVTTGLPSGG